MTTNAQKDYSPDGLQGNRPPVPPPVPPPPPPKKSLFPKMEGEMEFLLQRSAELKSLQSSINESELAKYYPEKDMPLNHKIIIALHNVLGKLEKSKDAIPALFNKWLLTVCKSEGDCNVVKSFLTWMQEQNQEGEKNMIEFIKSVAINFSDITAGLSDGTEENFVAIIERPGRHSDIIRYLAKKGFSIPIQGEQGFLTSTGRFVGREEGKEIASKAGQIKERSNDLISKDSDRLFSEDLW